MSNTLFPQSASYPSLASGMYDRLPAPSLVTLDPVKSYTITTDNRIPQARTVVTSSTIPTIPQTYYPPVPTLPMKKELDDLARKQEEFILRCQYPKRILPGELPCDIKKPYFLERRRELSGSPVDSRRKVSRHDLYRCYSKSPSRLWRGQRRTERSESRSPRRHPDYSPPGTRSPGTQADTSTPHRNK